MTAMDRRFRQKIDKKTAALSDFELHPMGQGNVLGRRAT